MANSDFQRRPSCTANQLLPKTIAKSCCTATNFPTMRLSSTHRGHHFVDLRVIYRSAAIRTTLRLYPHLLLQSPLTPRPHRDRLLDLLSLSLLSLRSTPPLLVFRDWWLPWNLSLPRIFIECFHHLNLSSNTESLCN